MSIYSSLSNQESFYMVQETQRNDELNYALTEKLDYRQLVNKFKSIVRKDHLDINPSWSGMNIKETSRDQLEMLIQADRIMCILLRSIEKIQIIGYLPELLVDNGRLLRQYLKKDESEFVINKFLSRRNSVDADEDKKQKRFRTLAGGYVDGDLESIIRILSTNKCLMRYSTKYRLQMSPFVKEFLNVFTKFGILLRDKLKVTAADERQREADLKVALRNFKERKANIQRLQEKLQVQMSETMEKMVAKDQFIVQIREKIGEVQTKFKTKMEDLIHKSEKQMMKESDISENRQNELAQDAKRAQQEYQSLLEEHLSDEKHMRAKRLKVEAQLSMWLEKYDHDIGERQTELDELMEEYEAERSELLELDARFQEQNKLYNKYKSQKDAEDEKLFQEVLFKFVANRSARTIQRVWRAYRQRKIERRRRKRERARQRALAKQAKLKPK